MAAIRQRTKGLRNSGIHVQALFKRGWGSRPPGTPRLAGEVAFASRPVLPTTRASDTATKRRSLCVVSGARSRAVLGGHQPDSPFHYGVRAGGFWPWRSLAHGEATASWARTPVCWSPAFCAALFKRQTHKASLGRNAAWLLLLLQRSDELFTSRERE